MTARLDVLEHGVVLRLHGRHRLLHILDVAHMLLYPPTEHTILSYAVYNCFMCDYRSIIVRLSAVQLDLANCSIVCMGFIALLVAWRVYTLLHVYVYEHP